MRLLDVGGGRVLQKEFAKRGHEVPCLGAGEGIEPILAALPHRDDAFASQNGELLRNGGRTRSDRLGEVTHASFTIEKLPDQHAASAPSEDLEER